MTYTPCNFLVKPELHPVAFSNYTGCSKLPGMDKRRAYFREWRRFRNLTQAQVVQRLINAEDPLLPTTEASLSLIERGEQNYNSRLLYALADIYNCEAGELLGRNPHKDGHVIDMLAHMDPDTRAMAIAAVSALAEQRAPYTPPEPPEPDDRLRPKRRGNGKR